MKKTAGESLHEVIQDEFKKRLEAAGSQLALARETGVNQSRIARMVSGKIRFENLTVETVEKLFPYLQLVPRKPHSALRSRIDQYIDAMDEELLTDLLLALASPKKFLILPEEKSH